MPSRGTCLKLAAPMTNAKHLGTAELLCEGACTSCICALEVNITQIGLLDGTCWRSCRGWYRHKLSSSSSQPGIHKTNYQRTTNEPPTTQPANELSTQHIRYGVQNTNKLQPMSPPTNRLTDEPTNQASIPSRQTAPRSSRSHTGVL